jgi:LacI family transcriptional regulator
MSKSARMVDVARLAGVSTMTVSRVLNDARNVSDTMRERVDAAVKQLSYQPNEVARSLRDRRSRQIGVLLPYLFDPFFANCAHAIISELRQQGYSVVLATSNEDVKIEFDEASRMLRRNVEGLILIPARPTKGRSRMLGREFERLPIVTLDRPIEGGRFESLLVENERGACLGTQHLIALGHKRIAYIGLENTLYVMRKRHKGYESAMKAARLGTQAALVSPDVEDLVPIVSGLLRGPKPPTAIFSANNLLTRRVLHSLQALDIYPPKKIALVGFDDFETADLIRPGITVVRQPSELLGRRAAETLLARLGSGVQTKAAKRTILPVDLIVRGSCGSELK